MSKKISQLEEKLELTGDEYLVLQDGTENRKAKASLLKGQDGASGIPSVVDHGTNDTTFALTPNVFHRWGEVATLNLTLGAETSGVLNEYMAQFTSGTTATVLTLPDTVTYIGESTIEADKTYQVSIINNLAVLGGA